MQLHHIASVLSERRREIRFALIVLALIATAIGIGLPFNAGDA